MEMNPEMEPRKEKESCPGRRRKKYDREIIRTTMNMAWPSMLESFFVAFAGLVDSLMVSSLGANAVAAVGLTVQPKFIGLSLFLSLIHI